MNKSRIDSQHYLEPEVVELIKQLGDHGFEIDIDYHKLEGNRRAANVQAKKLYVFDKQPVRTNEQFKRDQAIIGNNGDAGRKSDVQPVLQEPEGAANPQYDTGANPT